MDITKEYIKELKGISNKPDQELEFIADLINRNWDDDERDKALNDFLKIPNIEQLQWSSQNFSAMLSTTNVSSESPELKKWIFSSNKLEVYDSIYQEVIELISEYDSRTNTYFGKAIESFQYCFNGRSAFDKKPPAEALIALILNYILNGVQMNFAALNNTYAAQLRTIAQSQERLPKLIDQVQSIYSGQVSSVLPSVVDIPKRDSLSERYNRICHGYMTHIFNSLSPGEIRTLVARPNSLDNASDKSLVALGRTFKSVPTTAYNSYFDYTKIYSSFIIAFNNACTECKLERDCEDSARQIQQILDKIALNVYENQLDALGMMNAWMKTKQPVTSPSGSSNEPGVDSQAVATPNESAESPQSGFNGVEISHDYLYTPKQQESFSSKAIDNFSSEFDPMAHTNLPSKMAFFNNELKKIGKNYEFLRMSSQTRAERRGIFTHAAVYPSLKQYLHALQRRNPQHTGSALLYISNLRIDSTSVQDLAANNEGTRSKALIDLAELPDFSGLIDVVTVPANRSYLSHKDINKHDPALFLSTFMEELKTVILKNGQDFYLSDSVRSKLFKGRDQSALVDQWLAEVAQDMGFKNNRQTKISTAQRQQLAIHFFKYTLTQKLIECLNPLRVTTPCKDNIDRGAVHSMYFNIITLIKDLDARIQSGQLSGSNKQAAIDQLDVKIRDFVQYDIHSAAMQVKGRKINDNIQILASGLFRFGQGPYGESEAFPKFLKDWLDEELGYSELQQADAKKTCKRTTLVMPTVTQLDTAGQATAEFIRLFNMARQIAHNLLCRSMNSILTNRPAITYQAQDGQNVGTSTTPSQATSDITGAAVRAVCGFLRRTTPVAAINHQPGSENVSTTRFQPGDK